MAGLASLVLSIGADVASLVKQVDVVRGKIDSFEGIASKAGSALAGMFTIGAVVAATKQVIDYGGAITDLAARTKLSTTAAQELDYAAKQNGSSIDSVAKVIEKMGINLAGGGKSAVAGISALGLSLSELRTMAPDKQFEVISDKIRGIEDPAARAKIAFDIMGKGAAEVMPLIAAGVGEARDKARELGVVLSEDTVSALDDAGDAMDTLKTTAMVLVGQAIGPMLPALTKIASMLAGGLSSGLKGARSLFDQMLQGIVGGIAKLYDFAAAGLEIARAFPSVADKLGITAAAVEGLRSKAQSWRDTAAGMAASTNEVARASDAASKAIKPLAVDFAAQEEAQKKAAKAQADLLKEQEKFRESVKMIGPELTAVSLGGGAYWIATNYQLKAAVKDTATEIREMGGDIRDLPADLDFAMRSLAPFKEAVTDTGTEIEKVPSTMGKTLSDLSSAFASLAQSGGGLGSVAQYVGNLIGSFNLASKASSSLREGFDRVKAGGVGMIQGFADIVAGAAAAAASLAQVTDTSNRTAASVNGMLAGAQIGSSFGPIGSIVGALGGLAVGIERSARKARAETAAMREEITKLQFEFIDLVGPTGNVAAAMDALGFAFQAAFVPSTPQTLENLRKLMVQFKEAIAQANAQFKPLLQSVSELGIGLPQALSDSIAHLIEIGVLTGDTAALFKSLTEAGTVDWQKMSEAAQRYGIDLASLGPAFQSAQLHSAAEEIINDFFLLTQGGADVGGVLVGMADEINKLVNDSIKFGVDIPANMKPWIEELIRAGKLVDANGNKLVDTSQIKFSEPIETQFAKIVTALEGVISKLGEIANGINGIPSSKTVTIATNYVDNGPPPDWARGEGENGNDIPGFAVGTAGRFVNFGTGKLVKLHGRERVMTEAEGLAADRAAAGSAAELMFGFEDALARQTRSLVRGFKDALNQAMA